mmetsp:Transcript_15904/g.20375  ORF Transcript_15904/g.20375 Transcript_15904/m.20375 type:complete len:1265 (-) Transcript_15904:147-3941(-)
MAELSKGTMRQDMAEWGMTRTMILLGTTTIFTIWLARSSTFILTLIGIVCCLWLCSICLAVQGNMVGLFQAVMAVMYSPRTYLGEGKSWKSILLLEFLFWRLPTCWFRSLPDIFIIGAQKCGTTSLHSYLCDDTENFSAGIVKETHFIDGRSPFGTIWEHCPIVGRRLLRSFFDFSFHTKGKLVIEATPEGLYCGWMLPAILQLNPHAKFIVLLRDPIDRAYSSYLHQTRKGRENLSFDEAVHREILLNNDESHPLGKKFQQFYAESVEKRSMKPLLSDPSVRNAFFRLSYVARGRYSPQIKVLLNAVPREQCLFVDSADFFSETEHTLRMVRDWLGAHNESKSSIDMSPKNTSGWIYNKSMAVETLKLLKSQLSHDWPDIVSKYCTFPDLESIDKPIGKVVAKQDVLHKVVQVAARDAPHRVVNPIVFPSSHGRYVGSNVGGPSVIKVPDWIPASESLGKFYMYFAHHNGKGIRLAYADNIQGPWSITEKAVLHIRNCPGYDHVASPDVHLDADRQKIIMYFHSPSRSTRPFRKQSTYCAISEDGMHFSVVGWDPESIEKSNLSVDEVSILRQRCNLGPFYFRVFRIRGRLYALARNNRSGGIWIRKPGAPQHDINNPIPWERGNNIFSQMRHCFVVVSPDHDSLKVFYSRVGDSPEGIYVSTVDVSSDDWLNWKESGEPKAVYFPKDLWEGGKCQDTSCNCIVRSSDKTTKSGMSKRKRLAARNVRDPCLLDFGGDTWMFYAGGGETGIGVTRLHQEHNIFALKPLKISVYPALSSRATCTPKRVIIYDPGCIGLGHSNRCSQIAMAIMTNAQRLEQQQPDILVISGNGMLWSMFLDEQSKQGGIDCICLPAYQKQLNVLSSNSKIKSIWNSYYSKSLYAPSPNEKHSGYGLCALRSRIIKEVVTAFQPDLLLVDFEPLGVHGELIPALKSLRQANRESQTKTRIVLGLRDVLDATKQFKAEWEAKGVLCCLEEFYDEIVVYGQQNIHDPLQGILPSDSKIKTHYVGYLGKAPTLREKENDIERHNVTFRTLAEENKSFQFAHGKYLIVSGGGGCDAGYLYDWVLRAYEQHIVNIEDAESTTLPEACIVYGLFHPEELVRQFESRVNALNLCYREAKGKNLITSYRFLRHFEFEALLVNCLGLVGMCGANTFSEICKFNVRALCVPRDSFRKEQLIRAQVFANAGAVRMLRAECSSNSISEGSSANLTERMLSALLALPSQKKPSDVLDLEHLTDGLDRVCKILIQPCDDNFICQSSKCTTT